MNRLAEETSPYLLQHANNPVDWFPWGEEALQKARSEDKPILISIGYSACHWCHVMEKESFEHEAVAEIMNANFVNIKIDREERPDLDHIYMDALQAMSGGGGWPLNVFLTPDCKPFYGGTYFPPVRVHNRASWKEILHGIHQSFQSNRAEIEQQAQQLTDHLQKANAFGLQQNSNIVDNGYLFVEAQLHEQFKNIIQQADTLWGGFGNAPKFPQTFTIQWLLQYYHFTGEKLALQQACTSLDKMIMGGLYDHVAGGFARYSTDRQWLVPHFEKMLYDNALLVITLAEAYQLTKSSIYEETIRKTLDFVASEMMNEDGAFFSALDADSEGVEGKYYVWAFEEVQIILGDDAKWFCALFDVTPAGNWEETNILRLKDWPEPDNKVYTKEKINQCLQKLKQVRANRIKPLLDDKVILGWNALMNQAFSKAASVLNDEAYATIAIKNMECLKRTMLLSEGGAKHTFKGGVAKFDAFLDDYANLIKALLDLQELTGDSTYLYDAKKHTDFAIDYFSDEENIFFYFTHIRQNDVIVRKKEIYDGAVPSGNAVMAKNLWNLSKYFNEPTWGERVENMVNGVLKVAISYPTSFGFWSSLLFNLVYGTWEIVAEGERHKDLAKLLMQEYIPNKVFQQTLSIENQFPMLIGKKNNGISMLHYCKDNSCGKPVLSVAELLDVINKKKC